MRTLVLMRGCPASGKSTTIRDAGLEHYALSADDYRLKVSAPYLNEEGNFHITQKFDVIAWDSLYRDLEERMKEGHFTIVDACNASIKQCNRYANLASQYGYQIFVYNVNVDLEEALRRDAGRPEYKRVPAESIRRIHLMVESVTLGNTFKPINSFDELLNFWTPDITGKYDKVAILGDIHGSYTALTEALDKHGGIENERTLFVFLGDYHDRGAEERKMLDWLLANYTRKNLILLTGNHDVYLHEWCHNREGKTRGRNTFINKTLPQFLKDYQEERDTALANSVADQQEQLILDTYNDKVEALKSKVRQLARTFRQAYSFIFHGEKYICTHGGLTSVPQLTLIPTKQLINGVGDYETDVGRIYKENYLEGRCQDFIQFHGHRGVSSSEYSYCLEGEVEFGGYLKTVSITHDPSTGLNIITRIDIKNNVFNQIEVKEEMGTYEVKYEFEDKELEALANNRYTTTKPMKDHKGVLSISFSESVFNKNIWNRLTTKARGLFVEKDTGKIIARGYDKTFNYGQHKSTSKSELEKTLIFPVTAYEKYNGFFGILTMWKDELFFTSKTTTGGPFVELFKELFEREPIEFREAIKSYLKDKDVSITFEIIHNDDKHIVDYNDKEKLCILDVIPNRLEVNEPYRHIDCDFSNQELAKLQAITEMTNPTLTVIKSKFIELNTFEEVLEYMKELDKVKNLEGVMFVDKNGFIFKYKTKWYKSWKSRRYYRHLVNKYSNQRFPMQCCNTAEDVGFVNWMIKQPESVISLKGCNGERSHVGTNTIVDLMRLYIKEINP